MYRRRRRHSHRTFAGLLTLGLLTSVACKPKRSRVDPLCNFDVVSAQESKEKSLSPMTWLTLISPGVDQASLSRSGPLLGACGLVHEPLAPDFVCEGFDVKVQRVEGDSVASGDLVMSQLGEDRTLLWAATDELVGGETEGAAALAVWAPTGLEIHAVGALRGYRDSARVKLHSVDNMPVLVVESDRCDSGGKCTRVTQIVPIIDRRIRELPLYDVDRGCLGRAQFELTKKTERPLPGGWVRRFELSRAIDLVDGGGLMLTDLLVAKDHDAHNPDVPPRPVRRINARRPLVIRDGRWEVTEEDLWERVLREDDSNDAEG